MPVQIILSPHGNPEKSYADLTHLVLFTNAWYEMIVKRRFLDVLVHVRGVRWNKEEEQKDTTNSLSKRLSICYIV